MRKLFVMLMLCGVLVAKDPVVKNTGQNCPVEFTQIEFSDLTSPWPAKLVLHYKNTSDKTLLSVEVAIKIYSSVGKEEVLPADTMNWKVKPSKSTDRVWNLYSASYGPGGSDVSVTRVLFSDGTLWVADSSHWCLATIRPMNVPW